MYIESTVMFEEEGAMTVPRAVTEDLAAAPDAGSADPLVAMLPLLRALPVPAVLHRPDGTVVAASAVFEDMVGETVEGLTLAEIHALLEARFPTGRELSFADLCGELEDRARPEVAVDIRDRNGLFRAMIASGAVVRSGEVEVGVVVVLTEVTRLIDAARAAGPARG
jgi:PAS domain-containing protein